MDSASAPNPPKQSSQQPQSASAGPPPAAASGVQKRYRAAPAKTFQCRGYGECRMVFSRSEHLARHIRKHTGERPFACHCGKQFSRLDNLRQHAQTVHSDKHTENEAMMRELTSLHTQLAANSSKANREATASNRQASSASNDKLSNRQSRSPHPPYDPHAPPPQYPPGPPGSSVPQLGIPIGYHPYQPHVAGYPPHHPPPPSPHFPHPGSPDQFQPHPASAGYYPPPPGQPNQAYGSPAYPPAYPHPHYAPGSVRYAPYPSPYPHGQYPPGTLPPGPYSATNTQQPSSPSTSAPASTSSPAPHTPLTPNPAPVTATAGHSFLGPTASPRGGQPFLGRGGESGSASPHPNSAVDPNQSFRAHNNNHQQATETTQVGTLLHPLLPQHPQEGEELLQPMGMDQATESMGTMVSMDQTHPHPDQDLLNSSNSPKEQLQMELSRVFVSGRGQHQSLEHPADMQQPPPAKINPNLTDANSNFLMVKEMEESTRGGGGSLAIRRATKGRTPPQPLTLGSGLLSRHQQFTPKVGSPLASPSLISSSTFGNLTVPPAPLTAGLAAPSNSNNSNPFSRKGRYSPLASTQHSSNSSSNSSSSKVWSLPGSPIVDQMSTFGTGPFNQDTQIGMGDVSMEQQQQQAEPQRSPFQTQDTTMGEGMGWDMLRDILEGQTSTPTTAHSSVSSTPHQGMGADQGLLDHSSPVDSVSTCSTSSQVSPHNLRMTPRSLSTHHQRRMPGSSSVESLERSLDLHLLGGPSPHQASSDLSAQEGLGQPIQQEGAHSHRLADHLHPLSSDRSLLEGEQQGLDLALALGVADQGQVDRQRTQHPTLSREASRDHTLQVQMEGVPVGLAQQVERREAAEGSTPTGLLSALQLEVPPTPQEMMMAMNSDHRVDGFPLWNSALPQQAQQGVSLNPKGLGDSQAMPPPLGQQHQRVDGLGTPSSPRRERMRTLMGERSMSMSSLKANPQGLSSLLARQQTRRQQGPPPSMANSMKARMKRPMFIPIPPSQMNVDNNNDYGNIGPLTAPAGGLLMGSSTTTSPLYMKQLPTLLPPPPLTSPQNVVPSPAASTSSQITISQGFNPAASSPLAQRPPMRLSDTRVTQNLGSSHNTPSSGLPQHQQHHSASNPKSNYNPFFPPLQEQIESFKLPQSQPHQAQLDQGLSSAGDLMSSMGNLQFNNNTSGWMSSLGPFSAPIIWGEGVTLGDRLHLGAQPRQLPQQRPTVLPGGLLLSSDSEQESNSSNPFFPSIN